MSISVFPNGVTIRELKKIIKDWPEINENGEETKVWIETGWCTSNQVTEVSTLSGKDVVLASSVTRGTG